MASEMSLRDLGLWAALWRIDPWGEERADARNAITSYVVAETNRDPKRRSQPFSPRDFMPMGSKKAENVSSKIRKSMAKLPRKGK